MQSQAVCVGVQEGLCTGGAARRDSANASGGELSEQALLFSPCASKMEFDCLGVSKCYIEGGL